jgi:hypothetical protein
MSPLQWEETLEVNPLTLSGLRPESMLMLNLKRRLAPLTGQTNHLILWCQALVEDVLLNLDNSYALDFRMLRVDEDIAFWRHDC